MARRAETAIKANRRPSAELPPDSARLIGLLLGDAREEAGLPQSVAAKALDGPQSRIAKLELGTRQLQFLEAVVLSDLYGIALERLDPRRNGTRGRDGRRHRVDLPRTASGRQPDVRDQHQ